MQEKQVRTADNLSLSYRTLACGPAVMLSHGFAQWSQMWITNGVAQGLSERFTVIIPDRRGHGYSDRPRNPEDYGMRMVEDVFSVLDAEDCRTAHLVGFSQGSEIAWRAASECPDRIRSLFLIASGWPGPELEVALAGYAEILDWLPQAIVEGEEWLTPNPDIVAFRAIVASMPAVLAVPEATLAQLTVPAFGLAGVEDPERRTIERLAGVLPDFSFRILPETDHPGSSEHPSLPRLIYDFLTSVEARFPSASPKR